MRIAKPGGRHREAIHAEQCVALWAQVPAAMAPGGLHHRQGNVARWAEDNHAGSVADSCMPLQSICQPCTSRGNSCWLFSLRAVE